MVQTKKPTKRKRSPHPGVILIAPRGTHTKWRACWSDSDTGKETYGKLEDDVTTAEQRRAWAINKSKGLVKRKLELDAGATRASGKTIKDALDSYYAHHKHLGTRTQDIAKSVGGKFELWAKEQGLKSCDDVNRAVLLKFRAYLINLPKKRAKAGGGRGEFSENGEKRAPRSVNHDLIAIRAVCGYLVDLDAFARLNSDDLKRGFKKLPLPEERIEFLDQAEIKQTLEAAIAHDAATETTREDEVRLRAEAKKQGISRKEHKGKGASPKYDPIVPYLCFVLLGGVRRSEGLRLDWRQLALHALDNDGQVVGEIHIEGTGTKTKKRRTLALEVSPALRNLLVTMHEKAGKPKSGSVFRLTEDEVIAAADRLRDEYGAPEKFNWQNLRSTCGTFLTNSPGIFGASSAYRSAKQLGHSVAVAEKSYLGLVRGIPREARTLEAAMGIEDIATKITEAV